MEPDRLLEDLRERLDRYPAERFPVRHATLRFHLGTALARMGRHREAEEALTEAVRLFGDELPVERAKALNALGAVLRDDGRPDQAARIFAHAARVFADAGRPLEEGAAHFNLGLVLREANLPEAALAAFQRAQELLDPERVAAQAARAAGERGGCLLQLERFAEAVPVLQGALEALAALGEQAAAGVVANDLGLALLGEDRVEEALEVLDRATAAHPKSLRPDAYAMAKANLALAALRGGQAVRARLAALQARDTPQASPLVEEQASRLLEELETAGGLADLLAEEPPDRRERAVRDELARWADLEHEARVVEAGGFLEGLAERPSRAVELAEAWLGGLLELPPEAMEALVDAALRALAQLDPSRQEELRSRISRGMVRFNVPQWTRLRHVFTELSTRLGLELEEEW